MSGESGGHRLRLSMLNDQLTCKLCRGYFIDATTIIECLHSFCRSCIVKYLEKNKYCPICEVQVHKSKPLLNIRPDHTLQDIVYKLVPACYQNEMRCRRDFYAKNPEALRSTTSPEARGEPVESHIYSPDESLSLSLEYYTPIDQPVIGELGVDDAKETGSGVRKHQQHDQKDQQLQQKPRYLRCPAAVMVFHLQKLIRAKYGLSEAHRVDVMYKEETLCDSYTLMDVMYIYHWRRKVPLHLSYRIFESSPKRLKLAEDNENFKQSLTNAGISPVDSSGEAQNQQQQQQQQQQQGVPGAKREWREVQLKISETGVISVTGITSPDSKKNVKTDKKAASASSCVGGSASEKTTEAEPKLLPDDGGKTADSVNKSDKTRQETKSPGQVVAATVPADQPKTREKKIAETSGKNASKSETSKMSSESATTTLPKSAAAGTSENLPEQPREAPHQPRESNNNERSTVTRETRSRSDLRSSNVQETDQTVKSVSGGTETRKTKASTGETGSEKSTTANPKTPGSSESLETSPILTTDEEKLANRLHAASTNNNLANSNASDPPTGSSHEDIPTGNKKAGKTHETKNSQQQQSSAGSKIDALSAKLQFQPKIGEVNNTYSKKAPKEKRTILEKVLKKSSTQASSSSVSASSVSSASSSPSPSSSSSSSSSSCSSSTESTLTVRAIGKHSGESLKTRSSTASLTVGKSIRIETNPSISITSSIGNQTSQILNCLGGGTTITSTHSTTPTPSVSVSVTTMQKTSDRGENTATNRRGSSSSVEGNATPEQQQQQQHKQQNSGGELKNTSKSGYRRENQSMAVPSSESLASIGLNVSTSMQSSASTFPYTVQDLVNSGILKNSPGATKVSGLTIQKTSGISHQQQSSLSNSSGCAGSLSQVCSSAGTSFNLHTPSMTIYSISTPPKNSASGNLGGSSLYPNASTQITNSSGSGSKSATNIASGKSGNSNVEITSVYSVPPCPDAIPISLMKPTVRKHEVIAKATNVNEICAKIGTTGGSKINDICAKIGENSKEKNKAEARSRPEIPDLLKIAKKPLQSSSASSSSEGIGPKHIPNIPNVPIYTPSNSLAGESKVSYTKESMSSSSKTGGSLTSASQSALQVTKTAVGGGIGGAKKQSQSMGYTTLRHPPKSWNPTLSKNNYVALKNQAKESLQSSTALMSQQQETVGNVKSIGVKRIDSAKRRNTPRFLGNPASGVKPLYGVAEGKGGGAGGGGGSVESRESGATTTANVTSGKNSGLSMTKIDPKTLSPIVSSSNSPIVSPPPYSPSARGTCYQSFSREMCARSGGGGSPISSRNSPVTMLSTNPFIPSPTPNTHPRLFYPHYPPPFPESPRLSNPLIRSPIGIPPSSAYHSSLPPTINKFLPRTIYMPQTTGVYSQQQISQPPTVQRIPASSSSSSSPKSPKKSNSPGASFSITKTETQTSTGGASPNLEGKNPVLLGKAAQDSSAFNLSKTGGSHQQITAVAERSENPDKESGQLPPQGKRESFGKTRESEKQRRASGETERTRQREDDEERIQVSSGKKGLNEERDNNSGSQKSAEKDKCLEQSTRDAREVDNNKKDSEKVGTKVNGDLSNDNNSASDAKQQESFLRNEGKESRGLDSAKSNLSREAKESESGKQILATLAGNNNPNSEKNQGSKDCSEKKVEEQIGKNAEQIQGKNNKTTNAESQRNKAES